MVRFHKLSPYSKTILPWPLILRDTWKIIELLRMYTVKATGDKETIHAWILNGN